MENRSMARRKEEGKHSEMERPAEQQSIQEHHFSFLSGENGNQTRLTPFPCLLRGQGLGNYT